MRKINNVAQDPLWRALTRAVERSMKLDKFKFLNKNIYFPFLHYRELILVNCSVSSTLLQQLSSTGDKIKYLSRMNTVGHDEPHDYRTIRYLISVLDGMLVSCRGDMYGRGH